jgi:transcriptional regulator with XRE-family HTH domain
MVANPSGSVGVGRAHPSRALGQVVRALREERGLGQEALARKAGVTQTTVSYVERAVFNPQRGTIEKLGRGLGVSMDDIASRVVKKEAAAED